MIVIPMGLELFRTVIISEDENFQSHRNHEEAPKFYLKKQKSRLSSHFFWDYFNEVKEISLKKLLK
jgi:hypothetical protein